MSQFRETRAQLTRLTRQIEKFKEAGKLALETADLLDDLGDRCEYLYNWLERWWARAALKEIFNPVPVDFAQFVTGKGFLDASDYIYDEVLREGTELNRWSWDPEFGFRGKYLEAVLTGAIGSGKTTLALYTQAYQQYLLLSMRNAHGFFDLDPSSEILTVFQSATKELARGVDYQRFRGMIQSSPWFHTFAPMNPRIESAVVFPKNIMVKPLSGSATASLGQNVIGGIIDEVNFMLMVQQSLRSVGDANTIFDQAKTLYRTIVRRRESRFMKRGWVPGMLCIVSSKKYPGQFTDEKLEEAKNDPRIFVFDKRVWEVKPPGTYSEETFYLFMGDERRLPYVLPRGSKIPKGEDPARFMPIPIDFEPNFTSGDFYENIRDVAGISIFASHPFFGNQAAVTQAFSGTNIFSPEACDFETSQLDIDLTGVDLKEWRFAHVDLGLVSDSCGIAVGHVTGFRQIVRSKVVGEKPEIEILPVIKIDGVLDVKKPPGGEIRFEKIRTVFYTLRKMGMPIRWITYDSWQSVDSIQILRSRGFITGTISIDKTILPYDVTRTAVNDARLSGPMHAKLRREFAQLQVVAIKGKIDHPPNGSKDDSDATAGVVFGLSGRREVWARHRIPPTQIPASLTAAFRAMRSAEEKARKSDQTDEEVAA